MSSATEYRERAGDLLNRAISTSNMNERSRLISEAALWHQLARVAEARRDQTDCLDRSA
jgi:hypothetical protein